MAWRRMRQPPENAAYARALEEKAFQDGDVYREEFRITDRDGQARWMYEEISIHALGPDHWRIVGILIDITARMRLEEDLRLRADDLEQAARSKDQFLAVLGHELRNPLGVLKNTLFVLRHRNHDTPRVLDSCDTMHLQLERMLRLVDELRDVSRVGQDKLVPCKEIVDLRVIVTRYVEASRYALEERRHHLTVCLPCMALPVEADSVRLVQVLTNLLDNAAKYTDPGGRIEIRANAAAEGVVLSVRDTGMGIDPSLIPRIFDFFVQADRAQANSQGGLGIGLALAKGLVELHGGEITAVSDGPGHGMEFRITLPLAPNQDPAHEPPD